MLKLNIISKYVDCFMLDQIPSLHICSCSFNQDYCGDIILHYMFANFTVKKLSSSSTSS